MSNKPRIRQIDEPRIRIAPSLLAADFGRLAEEVARLESGGAEVLHLDVMDGDFVPNISFGIPVIEKLRGLSSLYFDTHLMISDPLHYADMFAKAGSDNLTFHIEVAEEPRKVIDRIRRAGVHVGVALNPGTPFRAVEPFVALVDLVLVMSVWPGFGGQKFLPGVLQKVRDFRRILKPQQRLEIDGGIDAETIETAAAAGVDLFVAGTSVFQGGQPVSQIKLLTSKASQSATPPTARPPSH